MTIASGAAAFYTQPSLVIVTLVWVFFTHKLLNSWIKCSDNRLIIDYRISFNHSVWNTWWHSASFLFYKICHMKHNKWSAEFSNLWTKKK